MLYPHNLLIFWENDKLVGTRFHLIVVWFHWKLRTKNEGNCTGRSLVRRILLTCIQLLLLQFLDVIWSMPTNFAFFKKPLEQNSPCFCLGVLVLLLVNYVYTSLSFPYNYVRWIVVDIDIRRKSTKIKVNPNNGVNNSNPITVSNRAGKNSSQDSRQDTSTKFKNIVIKFGAENRQVTFSLATI